jgi:hypothetical protein
MICEANEIEHRLTKAIGPSSFQCVAMFFAHYLSNLRLIEINSLHIILGEELARSSRCARV